MLAGNKAAILPDYQGRGIGSAGLKLVEEQFLAAKQWDLCTVLQDEGMQRLIECTLTIFILEERIWFHSDL